MTVIFDVDGVLIDVSQSYHFAIKDTVDHFTGKDNSKEDILDIKFSFNINNDWDVSLAGIIYSKSGLQLDQFKQKFKPYSMSLEKMYQFAKENNIPVPQYQEIVDTFEEYYHQHRDKEKLLFDHDVLERVRKKADVLGVITGRPFEDLDYTFKQFDLYKYFDYIITEDDIPEPDQRKPSSYPLKLFFEKIEMDKPVFYIGDTNADKKMVENFNTEEGENIRFILFENKHNRDIKSQYSIKACDEICEILNSYDYGVGE
ncbi:MAG: HAD-IA family hydrolase [Aquificae bacterium]|nr:HAD-IA family hydrolase [Aquificota bacterium]